MAYWLTTPVISVVFFFHRPIDIVTYRSRLRSHDSDFGSRS